MFYSENAIERFLDTNNCDNGSNNCASDLFSLKFCLQVLSMLMQHIEKGCHLNISRNYEIISEINYQIIIDVADDIMPEYVKIFSSLLADNYGAPLNGYPGAGKNNSPEQMMKGIVSTVLSEMENSRLFAHIKVIFYLKLAIHKIFHA